MSVTESQSKTLCKDLAIVVKYKRSKTALLRALPIKFAVRIFPLGRKGVKFCGKRQGAISYHLPQNEGKTTAERVGFYLKSAGAKCRAQLFFALIIVLSRGTFNRRLSEARYTPIRCTARLLDTPVRCMACLCYTFNYTLKSARKS